MSLAKAFVHLSHLQLDRNFRRHYFLAPPFGIRYTRASSRNAWATSSDPQADVRVGGIGVEVGERDRHRDQHSRRYHRDRAEIVINRRALDPGYQYGDTLGPDSNHSNITAPTL